MLLWTNLTFIAQYLLTLFYKYKLDCLVKNTKILHRSIDGED